MLPSSNSPTSFRTLLATFRLNFTEPSFVTFSALVRGFVAHVGERNVCGMLTGAGLTRLWHHSRAHSFFSQRRWSADRLGLQFAVLLVQHLLPAGAAIELAVDDTLFRRSVAQGLRGPLVPRWRSQGPTSRWIWQLPAG